MTTNNTIVLPSPPFVHAPGIANLRDAGGHLVAHLPGKAVRRGILFRGADPTNLDAEGVAVLQGLGVTHIYDLRSEVELAKGKEQPREWPGAKRVPVPVFLEKDYSPEALALRFSNYSSGLEGFVQAYSSILKAAAESNHPFRPFQTILNHLASSADGPPSPILVHCSAGKDRVIIALILSLCGVKDDLVAHDYSLTELGLAHRLEAIVEHLLLQPGIEGDREKARAMVSSRKEYMLGTLSYIRETYGSVEGYVINHLGVSKEVVERLRRNLIVDVEGSGGSGNVVSSKLA
ncbi:protein-tyrosine phosphatase-like protein [Podospora fimiseda]|uniref:Protein-tyrosine phosphatase-like protein n=1 Tax=Podospora fimiseda TaxID=252190 RepID=A0AAN6YNN5_9PEZI|nr:protein-tyrosine phosphatase-like protein [Podospora fimiseda]